MGRLWIASVLLCALSPAACATGDSAHRERILHQRQYELDQREARLRAAEKRFTECVARRYPGQDPGLEAPEQQSSEEAGAAEESGAGGVLSPEEIEEIQRIERLGRPAVIACYTKELERRGDKKLEGKVLVKILIGSSGSARQVVIGESTLKTPTVHRCIQNVIRGWEFPALKTASWYSTTFHFSPAY
jgi:outer membrane biosynthesis protein TonB